MIIPVMIDSGAYSAWRQGVPVDIQEYIRYVKTLLKRGYPQIVYVNLDVIGDGEGSYTNWKIMRDAGLDPLPIYHAGTDEKWLKKYLHHTDHIGLGAIANMSSDKRKWALDRIWMDYLLDEKSMPKFKVHAMGVTSFELMARYPWHSIDSTSWLQAGMYGKVFLPKRRNGVWLFNEQPIVLAFSSQSPTIKEKGKHIDSVSPIERKLLMDYLAFTQFPLGKSKMNGDEEEVIEEGVSNNYQLRCSLNAFFFSKFVANLPWPRPMTARKPQGLFDA